MRTRDVFYTLNIFHIEAIMFLRCVIFLILSICSVNDVPSPLSLYLTLRSDFFNYNSLSFLTRRRVSPSKNINDDDISRVPSSGRNGTFRLPAARQSKRTIKRRIDASTRHLGRENARDASDASLFLSLKERTIYRRGDCDRQSSVVVVDDPQRGAISASRPARCAPPRPPPSSSSLTSSSSSSSSFSMHINHATHPGRPIPSPPPTSRSSASRDHGHSSN